MTPFPARTKGGTIRISDSSTFPAATMITAAFVEVEPGVSLRLWLAFTPFDLEQAHLKIDRSVLANIPTSKTPIVPA